jgi:sugar phosphate permease
MNKTKRSIMVHNSNENNSNLNDSKLNIEDELDDDDKDAENGCFHLSFKSKQEKNSKNNEILPSNSLNKSKESINKMSKLSSRIKINYACICLLAFLTGCDFAVIIPTLWDRLHSDFNATGVFMGLVISAYSLCGVISGFVMGKLSDDRKNIKCFYLVSGAFAICGQCLYFFGISKYLILLSRCICGISLGASPVALAYIARTTSEKQRTSIISIVMASRQIGRIFLFLLFFFFFTFKIFCC